MRAVRFIVRLLSGQPSSRVGVLDNPQEDNQLNEIIEENGGQVFFTSTDQKGDFRIGTDLKVDRGSGTIEGLAFEKSLFAIMTPYILALED